MTQRVKPPDLREGDVIDLSPLLGDPRAHAWVWQPFGHDEQGRQEAIATARLVAECECAVVESVERIDGGQVVVYNDQINVTVPEDFLIERVC
jgi:hypothetical protein